MRRYTLTARIRSVVSRTIEADGLQSALAKVQTLGPGQLLAPGEGESYVETVEAVELLGLMAEPGGAASPTSSEPETKRSASSGSGSGGSGESGRKRARIKRDGKKRAAGSGAGRKSKLEPRMCPYCGEEYQPRRKDQVKCTRPACLRAYNREHKARRKAKRSASPASPKPPASDDPVVPRGHTKRRCIGCDRLVVGPKGGTARCPNCGADVRMD